ncbi:MAG: GNAT family N-acetyltransferase [Clostridia bacterium]|nr:GNAT family N-acetyltransferase [Clostridia bacterium]
MRRTTVFLHRPAKEELTFRRVLLSDPETMSYNDPWGGAIGFPPSRWDSWYAAWADPGTEGRFYRYVLDAETGLFVGETAYHTDPDEGIVLADVLIHSRFRNRGFGTRGLRLLCAAAKENGISELYDDIAAGNPGLNLFLRNGFEETGRSETSVRVRKRL